jgi:hypothetical protein
MGVTVVDALILPASDPFHVAMYSQVVRELERTSFAPDRHAIGFATEFQLEQRLIPGIKRTLEIMGRYIFRPRVWSAVDLPDRFSWAHPILGLLLPPRLSKLARP